MSEEVWYVAEGYSRGPGFTSQVSQALRDQMGAPVICPGAMKRIFERRKEQHARGLDNLWEHLLDLMEVMYEFKENMDTIEASEPPHLDAFLKVQNNFFEAKHRVQATIEALAILEYGYLWAEDKKNGTKIATGKVAQTAKVKYEQSAE